MTTFFPELVPETVGQAGKQRRNRQNSKSRNFLDLPKVAKSWVFAAFLFGTEEAKVAK